MTDEVDVTAKELPPVKELGPADSLAPSEPTLPPVAPSAPVRAKAALLLAETKDELPSVGDIPPVAATQTLDDEAEALDAASAPGRKRPSTHELSAEPPLTRPSPRKPTRALVAQDGFEGPSVEALPQVPPERAVSEGIKWTTVDWVVAALVGLMVLSVVLVFCAA